jgi:DNA helicase HerA-like ATPase
MKFWLPIIPFFKEPEMPPRAKPAPAPQPALVVPEPPKPKKTMRIGTDFEIDPADLAQDGERDAILASSGKGKSSYLAGVLMEETLEKGGLLCIIDPQGETYTLAWKYPVIVVGGNKEYLIAAHERDKELSDAERQLAIQKANERIPFRFRQSDFQPRPGDKKEEKEAKQLALNEAMDTVKEQVGLIVETMLGSGASIIFDLSEHGAKDRELVFSLIAEALFEKQQHHKRKIRLVIEEAQLFGPENGSSLSGRWCEEIAKMGRKMGIDSVWGTQRPASLDKDILSQCNRFWFGGFSVKQDFDAIKTFLNEAGISQEDIKTLEKGEFYCYANGQVSFLKVRKRFCKHAGKTPAFDDTQKVADKKEIAGLIAKLSTQNEGKEEEEEHDDPGRNLNLFDVSGADLPDKPKARGRKQKK